MKRMRVLLAFGLVLGLAAAVVQASDKKETKSKDSDISMMLQDKERQVQDAFKNKDVEKFMSLVDSKAWSADPSGFAPVSAVQEMMKQAEVRSFTMSDFKLLMISKEAYVLAYTWNGEGTMAGQPYPPGPWYCSTVWTKQGKDWKAVYHQETLGMDMSSAESH